MRAGNKADRYIARSQQIELLYHNIYVLLRLLIGIEQVSRNQDDVRFFIDSGVNNVLECDEQLLPLRGALVSQARELGPQVNISGMQNLQHDSYLSAKEAPEICKSFIDIDSLHP